MLVVWLCNVMGWVVKIFCVGWVVEFVVFLLVVIVELFVGVWGLL